MISIHRVGTRGGSSSKLNRSRSKRVLALFPFFARIEARFLEFMIGDGVLHPLDDEIDPLLNLD